MTLHKAIEAAREGFIAIAENSYHADGEDAANYRIAKSALSSLPAKPMSEEEIAKIMHNSCSWGVGEHNARAIINALRDAGVLYVEEK